jgi:hypothetical protein
MATANGLRPASIIPNIVTHVGLVLDASSSMARHRDRLVKAVDTLVSHLAARSRELDQETRISVWTFADRGTYRCLVWDKDVLRLPSIATLYQTGGMTALIDATCEALDDFGTVPTRYGDHSFLVYVLTDGQENDSVRAHAALPGYLTRLPEEWTVAALVPDTKGVHEAKRFGFPAGNVERWDTTSATGITEAGERIRQATDAYMTGRARGERSTRTLFSTGSEAVNAQTIRQAGLVPLRAGAYRLFEVWEDASIRDFVEQRMAGAAYVSGRGYYELTKAEDIQPQKELAFMSKVDHKVYVGRGARAMVGLPDMHVRIKPDHNPDYTIFVQSTSTNRRLKAGTQLLYMV